MPDRLPRRLNGLLKEFVSRAEELMRLQEHMNGLLAAVISIAEDLTLQSVLERVVQSARELVGARYSALAVISEDATLSDFVASGVDDDAHLLGSLPMEDGVLAELIRDPKPLRLHNLHEHLVAEGIPEDHPAATTFLGVPIRVRDAVFGNLFLMGKDDGEDFTVEDEELAAAFAAAAGVAIQNARLFEESRRRQRWLEAGLEASTQLITRGSLPSANLVPFEDLDASEDLDLVADHALRASDSVLAVIARVEDDQLQMRTAVGTLALPAGDQIDFSPTLQKVDEKGGPVIIPNASDVFGGEASDKLGCVLAVPLGHSAVGNRLLLLARSAGTGPYPPSDLDSSAAFGSHVGLALDLNRANRQREEALLSFDRDRIAQDLHDLVIQRLFAAGLSVQNLRRFVTDSTAEARINKVTEELDETIRELRNTIYSLRTEENAEESFSRTFLNTLQERLQGTGIKPRISVSGSIDDIPSPIARQLVAVVTEALSNTVRHSGARTVSVALSDEDGVVELVVEDDGRGFEAPARTSGLANIEHRAFVLNGTSEVVSAPGRGTTVRWKVPLPTLG
jgi:signal transduction histidine kinase